MLSWKWYQVSKLEMEFYMINMMYAALPMRTQTENITFSCKDNSTLRKHTWHWTYLPLRYFFYLYSVSLGDALTTVAVRPFFPYKWLFLSACLPVCLPPSHDDVICVQGSRMADWVLYVWNKSSLVWSSLPDTDSFTMFGLSVCGESLCLVWSLQSI